MKCVLFAESAVLIHLKSVRIVLLILHSVIVSLLTFCTSQCDFYSHLFHPFRILNIRIKTTLYSDFCLLAILCFFTTQIKPLFRGKTILSQIPTLVNGFLTFFCNCHFFKTRPLYIVEVFLYAYNF